MGIYTTEITSGSIPSDNPLHQRLLFPYFHVLPEIEGKVLEVGCGEGRGVEMLIGHSEEFTGVDKIEEVISRLNQKFPGSAFVQMVLPPLSGLADNSFDRVISFQVIEHIRKDRFYLEEIHRVLKPGGKAFITTPNRLMSLSRNPWHIREYTGTELKALAEPIFRKAEILGIHGNETIMKYHDLNRESVRRITRFDVLGLQYRLPSFMLRIPYEILNRMNRNKLQSGQDELVSGITHKDYFLAEYSDSCLDLFGVFEK